MNKKIKSMVDKARNPDTSWNRLLDLIEHPEEEVRRALLDNPNLCPSDDDGELDTELLEDLAQEFPEEVAVHPLFVLHALIEPNDEFEGVVITVVEGTKDVGLIEHVFRTWGPSLGGVRLAVAENTSTPEDILRPLGSKATEEEWMVREAVARNPNTPVDLLRSLANRKTESKLTVRKAAKEALSDRGLA